MSKGFSIISAFTSQLKTANKRVLLSPLGLLVLTACGGDSSGNSGAGSGNSGGGSGSGTGASRNGFGIKGPLENALAFLDYDDDGEWDEEIEPSARTSETGFFEFVHSSNDNFSTANVVILADENTIDGSSGAALTGLKLTAPATAEVVSIATTLMIEADMDEAQVSEALGLKDIENLQSYNPYADTENLTGEELTKAKQFESASQEVATVIKSLAAAGEAAGLTSSEAVAVSVSGLANAIKEKFDNADGITSVTINLSDANDMSDMLAVVKNVQEAADALVTKKKADDPDFDEGSVKTSVLKTAGDASLQKVAEFNTMLKEKLADPNTSLTGEDVKALLSTSSLLSEGIKAEAEKVSADENYTPNIGMNLVSAASNLAPSAIAIENAAGERENQISTQEHSTELNLGKITVQDLNLEGNASGDIITLSLDTDSQNHFEIKVAGDEPHLFLKHSPDYESENHYSVTITATDDGGKSRPNTFDVNVTNIDPSFSLTASKSISMYIEDGLSVDADLQNIAIKVSGFYEGINGANAVFEALDSETADLNAITVNNQGISFATDGGYQISLEFANFSPISLTELEEMFEVASDINDITLSGGFERIKIANPNGDTLLQLSHSSKGISWENPNAAVGDVDTFIIKGSFENQLSDYIDFIKKVDDAASEATPSMSTIMNLSEELNKLMAFEGLSASSDGETLFDLSVSVGQLSITVKGQEGDHTVNFNLNTDELENLDSELISLAGGEDKLLDMLLEGNLSEPILNFYSDASNFDGLELGLSYSFAGEELLDLSLTEFSRIENVSPGEDFLLEDLDISETSSNGQKITTVSDPIEEVAVNLVGFSKAEVQAAIDTVSGYTEPEFSYVLQELFVPKFRLENLVTEISEHTDQLKIADVYLNESITKREFELGISGDDAALVKINDFNEVVLKYTPNFESKQNYSFEVQLIEAGTVAESQAISFDVINVDPALSLTASKSISMYIEDGLSVDADLQNIAIKVSGFYEGINGANAVFEALDSETADLNAITVNNQGISFATDGGYQISLEFANFSPISLTELEEMFEVASDINDITLSGGFERIKIANPNGDTLLQLSHSSKGISWENPNAAVGDVDTFIIKGSFENQLSDYIDFIKKVDDAASEATPSMSTIMNLSEELNKLMAFEGLSASSDGETLFDLSVSVGQLSITVKGQEGDHTVNFNLNTDELENLDSELISLAGGEDKLLDMLLEGNLSEPILNFYSDASNFDGLELGLSYSFAGEELLDLSLTEFSRIENVSPGEDFLLEDLDISETSSNGQKITTVSDPIEEVAVNLVGFSKAEVQAAIDTVSGYTEPEFSYVLQELFIANDIV